MKNLISKHFPLLFNIVGYQTVWFLCVYGAAHSRFIPGLLAALVFAIVVGHISTNLTRDIRTLLLTLPIGFLIDSTLAKSGFISFSYAVPFLGWAPIWIMCLWFGFSFTLNHSLKAIYARPIFMFLFGFFGAPLAYSIAAYKFGVMSFNGSMLTAILAIACVWGFGLMALQYVDTMLSPHKEIA